MNSIDVTKLENRVSYMARFKHGGIERLTWMGPEQAFIGNNGNWYATHEIHTIREFNYDSLPLVTTIT